VARQVAKAAEELMDTIRAAALDLEEGELAPKVESEPDEA
jgi:hypothetical protein